MRARGRLVRRLSLLLLGSSLVFASAVYALASAPQGLGPGPGDRLSTTEDIRYWTPDDGWMHGVRTRTIELQEGPAGPIHVERFQGPHGPRGESFRFATLDRLELATEAGVRAGFPATHPLHQLSPIVNVAVGWTHNARTEVGAIDVFHHVGSTTRADLDLAIYEARHGSQFFVVEDTAWYRSVARTAYVDPLTGLVIDYEEHESIWRVTTHRDVPLRALRDVLQQPEKVWEATTSPTDASVQAMAEAAEAEHTGLYWRAGLGGIPLLIAGELCLWVAILGRVRRASVKVA